MDTHGMLQGERMNHEEVIDFFLRMRESFWHRWWSQEEVVAVGKICFYVFMFLCLYTTGGGGLYIRYLYMSKKHIIGLNRVKKTYFYVKWSIPKNIKT